MASSPSEGTSAIPEPQPESWLALHEAARLLGVHTNTLRRWADGDSIRSYRTVGGHRRLAASDVQALVRQMSGDAEERDRLGELAPSAKPVIDAVLDGALDEREGRLQLRSIGRDAGDEARRSGHSTRETVIAHLPLRQAIGDEIRRAWAGAGRSGIDDDASERGHALADAFFFGLLESAGPAMSRARGGAGRHAAAAASRRGPPQ